MLEYDADLVAAVLVQSDLIQIVAFVIDLPAFLLVQPRDDRQQRRLAAAGRTEDRVELPLLKLIGQIFQNLTLVAAVFKMCIRDRRQSAPLTKRRSF